MSGSASWIRCNKRTHQTDTSLVRMNSRSVHQTSVRQCVAIVSIGQSKYVDTCAFKLIEAVTILGVEKQDSMNGITQISINAAL